MNPLGLTARIVVAVALFVALAMSFVSSFLIASFEMSGAELASVGVSAWHGVGSLGGLMELGGFAVAVVSAALPGQLSVVRRLLAALAGSTCLLAAGLFVLFLVIETNDLPDGLGDGVEFGFGWSGYVTFAALAVGLVAAIAGALLPDRPAALMMQPPPQ